MSICKFCNTTDLEWSTNVNEKGKYYLFNVNTGATHDCRPMPIKLYTRQTRGGQMLDFDVRVSEYQIAAAITAEQMRRGMSLNKPLRTVVRGDELFVI